MTGSSFAMGIFSSYAVRAFSSFAMKMTFFFSFAMRRTFSFAKWIFSFGWWLFWFVASLRSSLFHCLGHTIHAQNNQTTVTNS